MLQKHINTLRTKSRDFEFLLNSAKYFITWTNIRMHKLINNDDNDYQNETPTLNYFILYRVFPLLNCQKMAGEIAADVAFNDPKYRF